MTDALRTGAPDAWNAAAAPYFRFLWPIEAAAIERHLLRLSDSDRRSRFCGHVSDDSLRGYRERLERLPAIVVAYVAGKDIRGIAELIPDLQHWPVHRAELSVTVESNYQNNGVGTELLRHATTIARNRCLTRIEMLCMAENTRMRRIARKLGAKPETEDGITRIDFSLAPPDWSSVAGECVNAAVALSNRWRAHIRAA